MKKIIVTICLFVLSISAFSQKKYIYLHYSRGVNTDYLSYSTSEELKASLNSIFTEIKNKSLGDNLNAFKDQGFYVEKMSSVINPNGTTYVKIILSNTNDNDIDSYVVFYQDHHESYSITQLTGDVPSALTDLASDKKKVRDAYIGEVINILAQHGFELDQYSPNYEAQCFLFSRKKSNTINSVRSVESKKENIKEMGRYNIKGVPVSANERGVQIIVYSDYSAKTIVVD